MIGKILVAIDGSNHSMKAVDYACEIGSALKAEIILLYVLKVQELPEGLREFAEAEDITGGDMEILRRISGELLARTEAKAKSQGIENISTEIREGPIARTIVARAERHDVSMIVIGSRGFGNIEATLRGGVSHRVELLSKCPVLTVK